MVFMRISQQENSRKQAEFLKNVAEFFQNWPNFITSLAGRPCCDLATVFTTLKPLATRSGLPTLLFASSRKF
jgi:hypothetical protein